jgi:hypothetical protein
MNTKNTHKTVALITGLVVTLSMTAFAQEQNGEKKKDEGKPAGAQQHVGQAEHHAAPQGQAVHHAAPQEQAEHHSAPQQQVSHASNQVAREQGSVVHQDASQTVQSGGTAAHNHKNQAQGPGNQQFSAGAARQAAGSAVAPQVVQSGSSAGHNRKNHAQFSSGQQLSNGSAGGSRQFSGAGVNPQVAQSGNNRGGGQSVQPQTTPNGQYNSGNNYGGYWSSGDTHSDWSHNGQHSWNNNNYVWYQGGWLMINAVFNPFYVNTGYSGYGYSNNGSVVSSVQSSLANNGYYNGPIDGDAGPGTRNAIARYQSDNNLNVTGHINGPLLQSLQIQ